ncbi:MAG: DUF481 domain-containing protein [Magnetococcales bacterium]|nr:DUF481 domain-containing protein [Magnetococcales bacterium]
MIKQNKLAISLSVAVSVYGASSIAMTEEGKKKWSDQAEFSYVTTSGNSDTQNLALKNSLEYQLTKKVKLKWDVSALRGESDGTLSSESYATSLRTDYDYSKSLFVFLVTGWEKDEFAGVKSKLFIGPGAGYNILSGPKHTMATEAGINYVQEEFTNDTDNSYANGRLFGEYGYQFNEKSKFTQTLEYLHDFDEVDNFNVNSETSVTTAFTDIFSLKVGYTVKYDNEPLSSAYKKTDSVLAATLLANF